MRPTLFLLVATTALRGDPTEPHVLARFGDSRFRLRAPATVLACSADGKQLATWDRVVLTLWSADGRQDRVVRLGEESERGIEPQSWTVHALRFTADGKGLFVAGSFEGRYRLARIDPTEGKLVSDRALTSDWWFPVFAPDGSKVILYRRWGTGFDGYDKARPGLRCFNTVDGKELWTDPKPREFRTVVFRPDGDKILASDAAGPLREYAADTGVAGPDFQLRDLYTTGMAYSRDGKRVYGSAELPSESSLFAWDLGADKPRWVVPCKELLVVGLLDEGHGLVAFGTGGADPKVPRWFRLDPETGKQRGDPIDMGFGRLDRGQDPPEPLRQTGFAWHPDGKSVAVATSDRLVRLWDLSAGRPTGLAIEPKAPVTHLHLTAGGARVRGWAREWYEWDIRTGKQTSLPPAGIDTDYFRLRSDGRITIDSNRSAAVYDPETARTTAKIQFGFDTNFRDVSTDGLSIIAFETQTGKVRGVRWDLATGRKTADWPLPEAADLLTGPMTEVALSPGGDLVVVACGRGLLLDAATGRRLAGWDGPPSAKGFNMSAGSAFAFRPDSRSLLEYAKEPFRFSVREVATGGVRTRTEFNRPITDWSFTPDGRAFLVATRTHPVEIWSAVDPGGNWKARPEADVWAAIAESDAELGYTAIRHLWAHPAEAVAFLKARVTMPGVPSADWVAGRVGALDAAGFRDREKATAELLEAGEAVLPALRAALPTASAEARERLDGLIAKIPLAPARLRPIRVCEVVEGLGTPAALDLLREWAKADAATTLGREARASVERIGRR